MIGGGDNPELVKAPALAEIQRRIISRAYWLCGEPFAVDPRLWGEARSEHAHILSERGWPLAQSNDLAGRGIDHFLLCGIAIIKADA